MKRTYINPQISIIAITESQMIAESMGVGGATATREDIGFVKGESSSRSNHSVWDDDWSKDDQ